MSDKDTSTSISLIDQKQLGEHYYAENGEKHDHYKKAQICTLAISERDVLFFRVAVAAGGGASTCGSHSGFTETKNKERHTEKVAPIRFFKKVQLKLSGTH